jgi:hypothetical protein
VEALLVTSFRLTQGAAKLAHETGVKFVEAVDFTTREAKVDEAVRAFKKIYLEVVHRIIDRLASEESANPKY